MFRTERHPRVGVVVEESEIRSPAEPHCIPRIEHDSHDGLQALRPLRGRANRSLRPVIGARPLFQFAVTSNEREGILPRGKVRALTHFAPFGLIKRAFANSSV